MRFLLYKGKWENTLLSTRANPPWFFIAGITEKIKKANGVDYLNDLEAWCQVVLGVILDARTDHLPA
jgi:hypothetical protein